MRKRGTHGGEENIRIKDQTRGGSKVEENSQGTEKQGARRKHEKEGERVSRINKVEGKATTREGERAS